MQQTEILANRNQVIDKQLLQKYVHFGFALSFHNTLKISNIFQISFFAYVVRF